MKKAKPVDKLIIQIVENKGGSRKSTTAAIILEHFLSIGNKCMIIDGDASNSTIYNSYSGTFVDVTAANNEYVLPELALSFRDSNNDVMVVDYGARDADRAYTAIAATAQLLEDTNVAVIIVRPITLNAFVQRNALDFASAVAATNLCTLFVRCECGGEHAIEFERWLGLAVRASALKTAAETEMIDFSSYMISNASSFGLRLGEVAKGDFSRLAGEDIALAREIFLPRHQLKMAACLAQQSPLIEKGIREALAKRGFSYVG